MKRITYEEAKSIYCKGGTVFYDGWKLPESYQFASHAPAEVLFLRCLESKAKNGIFEIEDR